MCHIHSTVDRVRLEISSALTGATVELAFGTKVLVRIHFIIVMIRWTGLACAIYARQ